MNSTRILIVAIVIGVLVGTTPYWYPRVPGWWATYIVPPATRTVVTAPASETAAAPATAAATTPARGTAAPSAGGRVAATPAATGEEPTPAAEADAEARAGSARRTSPTGAGAAGASAAAPNTVVEAPSTAFFSANAPAWRRMPLEIAAPTRLRTGGEMALGPSMIRADGFHIDVPSADLVLASAPYMSVIGRLCGTDGCSKPFAIGTGAVVCPSRVGREGHLELWTNNYRGGRVEGSRSIYSQVSGGFYVYAEAVSEEACGGPVTSTAASGASMLAPGAMLAKPEFVLSSRQGSWKPFFVPLGGPIRIRATGEVRPHGNLVATGPEGIAVTGEQPWYYPGTFAVVVDANHRLFAPSLPYQALIGRLCDAAHCDAPFLVGRERTICPGPDVRDRLELWINNTMPPRGLIEQTMPLTLQYFDLQTRTGEYRFTIEGLDTSGCADAAAR